MVKKQKIKYHWCFWRIKCKNECPRDVFTGRNELINVRSLQQEEMHGSGFHQLQSNNQDV